jgi:tripeptide aminopeptidase
MINSVNIAHEFHALLPVNQRPEHTENYEGFYHLSEISGNEEKTTMSYIIRNHDITKFEAMKQYVISICEQINEKYQKELIKIQMKDTYYNMHEKIKPHMHIIETAKNAIIKANIQPLIRPVRGGTDGSKLSYMGLPCPNLFTGGHNYHGRYEFIPVKSMEKAVEVIVNIIKSVHDN